MTGLIAKLEAAEAGSRELDREIFNQLLGGLFWPENKACWIEGGLCRSPRMFTTSLDAALALAERLGMDVSQLLNDALEGPMGEGLWATGWDTAEPIVPQIARFVCIAILRAKEAGQ